MKLVIFDLDGVIVSTDSYHYLAWKSLADEYNFVFNHEINHMLRGVSRAESLKIILDVNGRSVDIDEFQTMLTKKNEIYKESLKGLSPEDILPGVRELIEDLKRNNVYVAIGSSSRNTPTILERISLSQAFDVVVDGNMITHSKPDPEVFLRCASALHIEPQECVVYEDASAGIEAACLAGMFPIGVGTKPLEGAVYMVSDLSNESYESVHGIMEERK